MKALILLLLTFGVLSADRQNEIAALYQEIVEKTREDMSKDIRQLKNPFIKPAPKKVAATPSESDQNATKPKVVTFDLRAIINHSAKINSAWYQKGDMLHGYKVAKITPYKVILQSSIDDGREPQKILELVKTSAIDIRHTPFQPDTKVEKQ